MAFDVLQDAPRISGNPVAQDPRQAVDIADRDAETAGTVGVKQFVRQRLLDAGADGGSIGAEQKLRQDGDGA